NAVLGGGSAWASDVAALGLRADLRVAVDDDAVGALVEGQRLADGLAPALVEDFDRRARDDVRLVGGRIDHLRALGLAVLLAQREVPVRFRARELVGD